jgi:hypothetical protein
MANNQCPSQITRTTKIPPSQNDRRPICHLDAKVIATTVSIKAPKQHDNKRWQRTAACTQWSRSISYHSCPVCEHPRRQGRPTAHSSSISVMTSILHHNYRRDIQTLFLRITASPKTPSVSKTRPINSGTSTTFFLLPSPTNFTPALHLNHQYVTHPQKSLSPSL